HPSSFPRKRESMFGTTTQLGSRISLHSSGMTQLFPIAARPAASRSWTVASLLLRFVLFLVVAFDVLAPGLRANRTLGLPDDIELAVLLHLADEHGLPQVMVLLVHLDREAVGRGEC